MHIAQNQQLRTNDPPPKIKHFDNPDPELSWEQAFAYCRAQRKPVAAKINGERWTLFPSGAAERC